MQTGTRIVVKGMVCGRCISVVQNELQDLGFAPLNLNLGEITLPAITEEADLLKIEKRLAPLGFSLLENGKRKMVRALKELVKEVYSGEYDFPQNFRFSDLAAARLQKDYDSLSKLFFAEVGKTLERFLIDYRIEKVKELLVYTHVTLNDIAFRLNFNSSAHLSAQFRQNTGLTPSFFREMQKEKDQMKQQSKPKRRKDLSPYNYNIYELRILTIINNRKLHLPQPIAVAALFMAHPAFH